MTLLPWYDPAVSENEPGGVVRVVRDATEAVVAAADSFDETYSELLAEVSRHSLLDTYDRRQAAPALEYTHDTTGKFLSMNDAGLKTYGFTATTIQQFNILRIVSEKHKKHLKKSIKKQFADVSRDVPVIWRTRMHDGTPLWVEIRAELRTTPSGTIVHGVGWPLSMASIEQLHRHSRVVKGGRIAAWDRELTSDRFFVSSDWKRLLGIPDSDSVTFRNFLDRIHPDDRVRVKKAYNDHEMKHRDFYDTRYRIRHNDGGYRWMHAIGKISEGLGGAKYISGHNIDITSEMADSRSLMDRESLFRAIVDSDPAMIFIKNKAREFAFVNTALCHFYRTSAEDAFGKTDDWFFRNTPHNDDIQRQLEGFRKKDDELLNSKVGTSIEINEFIVPPGAEARFGRWFSTVKVRIELDGMAYVVGISSDVTRLYLEKDMYESLLELSPAAMFVKTSSGEYLMANRPFVSFLGASHRDKVIKHRASDFLAAQSAADSKESDQACLKGHVEESVRRTVQLSTGVSKQVLGSKRSVRVLDDHGEFQERLIGCDIDESQTRDATQIELLDSLLTSLKHDFVCRFLGIIEAELQTIPEDGVLNGRRDRWRRMLRYSQDFIKRLQWLGPRPISTVDTREAATECSVSQAVNEACELANMLEEVPACDVTRVAGDLFANCDGTLLANVIFNLLINAKRFTLGAKKSTETIVVSAEVVLDNNNGKWARIGVEDGGVGLRPDVPPMSLYDKGKAFDPIGKGVSLKGTGTGLYFAKIIVEEMLKGRVDPPIVNGRGGATFSFVIPCQHTSTMGDV